MKTTKPTSAARKPVYHPMDSQYVGLLRSHFEFVFDCAVAEVAAPIKKLRDVLEPIFGDDIDGDGDGDTAADFSLDPDYELPMTDYDRFGQLHYGETMLNLPHYADSWNVCSIERQYALLCGYYDEKEPIKVDQVRLLASRLVKWSCDFKDAVSGHTNHASLPRLEYFRECVNKVGKSAARLGLALDFYEGVLKAWQVNINVFQPLLEFNPVPDIRKEMQKKIAEKLNSKSKPTGSQKVQTAIHFLAQHVVSGALANIDLLSFELNHVCVQMKNLLKQVPSLPRRDNIQLALDKLLLVYLEPYALPNSALFEDTTKTTPFEEIELVLNDVLNDLTEILTTLLGGTKSANELVKVAAPIELITNLTSAISVVNRLCSPPTLLDGYRCVIAMDDHFSKLGLVVVRAEGVAQHPEDIRTVAWKGHSEYRLFYDISHISKPTNRK